MICEICKKPIEQARLDALPNTTFCIMCAKKINIPRAKEVHIFNSEDEPLRLENDFS